MFNASSEYLVIEELIRKNWSIEGLEKSVNEDGDWELLTSNNLDDATSRHWFKQNYINQMPQERSSVMYH